MSTVRNTLSLDAFVSHYALEKKEKSTSRHCFILGSGASMQSGIPTGGILANQWLDKIKEIFKDEFDEWKKEINLEEGKEAEKYSDIYDKRFSLNYKSGYEFLEKIMKDKKPSYGYSVLAQILDKTSDNIVITTNFDHLIEDAMMMFADKRPLMIGHELLAEFVDIFSDKPLIAKIHRDLFFAPKSASQETKALEKGWQGNLTEILNHYIPVVIGYGGNDGSLMGFLEEVNIKPRGMFWCYYEGGGIPSERIQNLVKKFHGHLIPIKGFDEMMLSLNNALEYESLEDKIIDIARTRAEEYKQAYSKAFEQLAKDAITNKDQKVGDMLLKATSPTRKKQDWWAIQLEIKKEKDVTKQDEMYQQGIEETNSSDLIENYANFLNNIKKDYSEAEKFYKRALELDPNDATYLGNYALFLKNIKKDYAEAENCYKIALELDPNHANNLGNYAYFLNDIKKDYIEAEKYYKRVLEINPNNVNILGDYANFLYEIKQDYAAAEKYYKRALEVNPNDAINLGNYAEFLYYIRKDYVAAEKYYKKALEFDPNYTYFLGGYAIFLYDIKKDYDKAEMYFEKALVIDPNHAIINGSYANFLYNIKKDYEAAEKYYKKAFEIDPNYGYSLHANNLGNYAEFLKEVKKDYAGAQKYYKKALEVDPNHSISTGKYKIYLEEKWKS